MNAQTEISGKVEKPIKWRSIRRWLAAIDDGFNFDPNEYTYNTGRTLSQKVDEFEARLVELESERNAS